MRGRKSRRSARNAGASRSRGEGGAAASCEGRTALLQWLNSLLQLNVRELAEFRSGTAFSQLLHMIFPHQINLSRIKWMPRNRDERVHNMRVFQQALCKLNIHKVIVFVIVLDNNYE